MELWVQQLIDIPVSCARSAFLLKDSTKGVFERWPQKTQLVKAKTARSKTVCAVCRGRTTPPFLFCQSLSDWPRGANMAELLGGEFYEAMFFCINCPWKKNEEETHWGVIKEVNEEPVGSSVMSIFQIWLATMILMMISSHAWADTTFVEPLIKLKKVGGGKNRGGVQRIFLSVHCLNFRFRKLVQKSVRLICWLSAPCRIEYLLVLVVLVWPL